MTIDPLFRCIRIGKLCCITLLLALLFSMLPVGQVVAKPGDLDPSFLEPNPTGAGPAVPGNSVSGFVVQPDGKIVVSGRFDAVNGVARDRLARMNSDGSLDATFAGNFYTNYYIYTMVELSDGDLLLGGTFTNYRFSKPTNHIMRLNSDGTLDTAFNSAIDVVLSEWGSPESSVNVIVPLSDGDFLVGGNFNSVGGVPRKSIARLNADGTLDTDFMKNPEDTGANGTVLAMVRQPDGKILISGMFSTVSGAPRGRIARLEADGRLDSGFSGGVGATNIVSALTLLPDGKVLVGGYFENIHGSSPSRPYIARLESNGNLDNTFQPNFGPREYVQIRSITRMSDGDLLVAGYFGTVNGEPRNNVVRLNADGTTDETYKAYTVETDGYVSRVLVQASGKILIGGTFTRAGGMSRNLIARLNANGSLDSEFLMAGANHEVNAVAVQPGDGKVLVGGRFSVVNGLAQTGIARLNPDGTMDAGFQRNAGGGVSGGSARVNTIVVQPDGGILVGGNFTKAGHRDASNFARFDPYGNPDAAFNTAGLKGTDGEVYGIALQPDGKILVVGNFQIAGDWARKYIARFNAVGTLDSTFIPSSPDKMVYAVAVQDDGKVLIAGEFTTVGGLPRGRVARLNADGLLDVGYFSGVSGAQNVVRTVGIDPQGNAIIGGWFTSVNGLPFNRIARLSKIDGSPDPAFLNGIAGPDNGIRALEVQPNGTIIIGGEFFTVNGTECKRIAVLNPDGSLNPNFGCQGAVGINGGWVNSVVAYRGAVFIGGDFTEVRGAERGRVAKLEGVSFRVLMPMLTR